MRRAFRSVTIGLLALLMAACTSGRVTSIWTAPGGTASSYRDIVVFGVADSATVRHAYEDNFVMELKQLGVKARPGHTLASSGNLSQTAKIKRAVSGAGADGVIITHLIAEDTKEIEPPTRATFIPELYRRILSYYKKVHGDVSRPDYYADYQALRLETNLYDGKSEALIWSGRSRPLDPKSEQTTISQVIADVIAQMRMDGVLP